MLETLRHRSVGVRTVVLFIVVCALFALPRIISHLNPGPWRWTQSNADVGLYHQNAVRTLEGQIPYRDFVVEYPPAALIVELIPALLLQQQPISFAAYATIFSIMMAAASVMTLRLCENIATHYLSIDANTVRIHFLTGLTLLSVIAPFRLDIVCGLLLMTALWFHLRTRNGMSGFVLAWAVLLKLFPVMYLPVMCASARRGNGRAQMWRQLVGFVGTVVMVLGIAYGISGPPLGTFLIYHTQRSLQVESVSGAAVLLLQPSARDHIEYVFGADHIQTPLAQALAQFLPFVTLIVVGTITVMLLRAWTHFTRAIAARHVRTLVSSCGVLTLAFIVCSKVYSPQYLLWLLPMMALSTTKTNRLLYYLICALSIFNLCVMTPLVLSGDIVALLLLNVRNIMSILLLIGLGRDVVRDISKVVDESMTTRTAH